MIFACIFTIHWIVLISYKFIDSRVLHLVFPNCWVCQLRPVLLQMLVSSRADILRWTLFNSRDNSQFLSDKKTPDFHPIAIIVIKPTPVKRKCWPVRSNSVLTSAHQCWAVRKCNFHWHDLIRPQCWSVRFQICKWGFQCWPVHSAVMTSACSAVLPGAFPSAFISAVQCGFPVQLNALCSAAQCILCSVAKCVPNAAQCIYQCCLVLPSAEQCGCK